MSTELTVIQPAPSAITQTAVNGVDFSNPLFKLRPATVTLVQNNTAKEGAVPGSLLLDNGDQYKELTVALLAMPAIIRNWHGTQIPGQLNRTPENLQCYSLDNIQPHPKAKNPQSMYCKNCQKASWDRYSQTKLKTDIPECDQFYKAIMVDTTYQMPLQLFIRSKAKEHFEKDMKNLARELYKLKVTRKSDPNFFDIRFTLSAKKILTNKLPSYVYSMTGFGPVTDEDREAFGDVYKMFIEFSKSQPVGTEPEFDLAAAEGAINNVVIDGDYQNISDQEIPF